MSSGQCNKAEISILHAESIATDGVESWHTKDWLLDPIGEQKEGADILVRSDHYRGGRITQAAGLSSRRSLYAE